MIAIDTNILVYAHREDSPWHEKALAVVTELANSGSPWECSGPPIAISRHFRTCHVKTR